MMLRQKKWVVAIALGSAAFAGLASVFFWPHRLEPVSTSTASPRGDALIARGRYLATAADCAACHTVPNGRPFAGGTSFKLPFGKIYAPNITPDRTYGIGAWSDAEFVRALREGVGRHGEDLYPAFPYTSYSKLSNDDALAIRAFLATMEPVHTPAPSNDLAFPFDQRRLMRAWKLLFFDNKVFTPDPTRSISWNRGNYLVNGLAHCGECHTPRNMLFATKTAKMLSGGVVDGWKAWNITSDPDTGIGGWSDSDLVEYLSSGYAVGHGAASGSMREAVEMSLGRLPRRDIEDMVTYLRTVPSRRSDPEAAISVASSTLARSGRWVTVPGGDGVGKRIFEAACVSCHGYDGNGQQMKRASLAGAHALSDPAGDNLIGLLLDGSHSRDDAPSTSMPAFGAAYSDVEIAAVANYTITQFSGKRGQVTPDRVAEFRK
ncbi:c-type cytochrome [Burkholderia contaminans]|uniref:c-type cytochrome n=1 Tax=Burkholderia contaminans TaxID=488447 RepID=UPI001FC88040|nr:c-type cytochrome [Burkholderia contaminans]